MSTEHDRAHLHAVNDDGNGFTDEPTNPGSHGAVSRELRMIRKAIQASAQREVERDVRIEAISDQLGRVESIVTARIPPYVLWILAGCALLITFAAVWSVFVRPRLEAAADQHEASAEYDRERDQQPESDPVHLAPSVRRRSWMTYAPDHNPARTCSIDSAVLPAGRGGA